MTEEQAAAVLRVREERRMMVARIGEIDKVLAAFEQRGGIPATEEGLIGEYIRLRDDKAAMAGEHKERQSALDDSMARIEGELMRRLKEGGMQSLSSKAGTAYIHQKTSASVADWDSLLGYAIDNERFDLLGKHVNKEAVKGYMEENDGDFPPGVDWRVFPCVQIRRS